MPPELNLRTKALNVTSQHGEDGIIGEIFRNIGTRSKCCVEFGAWDGKYLSNSWKLWHDEGWSAVLVEGEKDRHAALVADLALYPKVSAVCAFVRAEGDNSLDAILERAGIGIAIDLLSIDVDGDEYYIWQGLRKFQPRVVVIEHNPTIPPEMDLVQKSGEYFGASAGSLVRLAHEKGYQLAACTETNCIFVTQEDFPKLGFPEPSIASIFPRSGLAYLVNAYDGRIFLTRNPVYSKPLPRMCVTKLLADLREELFPKSLRPQLPIKGPGGIAAASVTLFSNTENRSSITSRIRVRLQVCFEKFPPIILWRRFQARRADEFRKAEVVRQWRSAGCPSPTPHEAKQEILQKYARRHHLDTLVETGTYLGDMVAAMRKRFRRIYSIELGEELWQRAHDRFAAHPKITILQGDSAVVLGRVLTELNRPSLFWLDGHYSAGVTAKGVVETPILAELKCIFAHSIRNHVVLIDDARCFDGTSDYPTLASLRKFVMQHRPDAKVDVSEDIIRITF